MTPATTPATTPASVLPELYDAVARSHDHRPRPRPRDSADGMRPRRPPHLDRRGTVGVAPDQVNTLIPYIPPIDTSMPPPSREWLDARAKQFLAEAHADFQRNDDDAALFEYDTDSSGDGPVTTTRRPSAPQPQPPPQAEPERASWSSDSDSDSDTDVDMYDGCIPHTPPTGPWIIPRKRPSVVIVDRREISANPVPPLAEAERPVKRQRNARQRTSSKKPDTTPRRHAGGKTIPVYYHHHYHHILTSQPPNGFPDRVQSLPPPSRYPSSLGNAVPGVSSVSAAAAQMNQVRIASPSVAASQPHDGSSVPPRSPKVFPCLINGCDQVCASLGDLQRHQQSLRHSRPSHSCLACGKSYTRLDALKRHLNSKASCQKVHAAKQLEHSGVGEELAEAN